VSLKFTVGSGSHCLKYILSTSLTAFQFLTPHSFAIRYEILTVLISTSGKLLLDLVLFFHLYSYVLLGDYIEVSLRIIFLRYNSISRFSIICSFFSHAKKIMLL
jgi:hypothetical protein